RIATERLAELLVEDHLDEGGDALLLRLAGFAQRFRQLALRLHRHALEAAAFGDPGVAQIRIELGADEIVGIPEDRVALLRTPLIVAEDHHGDPRPLLAADRAHLAHGNTERAIAGEADAG